MTLDREWLWIESDSGSGVTLDRLSLILSYFSPQSFIAPTMGALSMSSLSRSLSISLANFLKAAQSWKSGNSMYFTLLLGGRPRAAKIQASKKRFCKLPITIKLFPFAIIMSLVMHSSDLVVLRKVI